MKLLKTLILTLVVLLSITVLVLLTPSLWKEFIEYQINDQLTERGDWEISFNKVSGHLLANVSIQSLRLTNLNKSSIFISNVDLRLNILESLFGYPSFKYLKLKEVTTTLFQSTKSSDLRSDPFDLKEILEQQVTVDRLQFDGRITIPEITILKDFLFQFDGRFDLDMNSLDLDVNELYFAMEETGFDVRLVESRISLFPAKLVCENINGTIDSLGIKGKFSYNWLDDKDMRIDVFLDQYQIPKTFFDRLPLQPKLSALETEIHIQSDLKTFEGNITLTNDLGLQTSGNISLSNFDDFFSLDQMKLDGEDASLSMSGIYQKDGHFNVSIELTNFDLNKWIIDDLPTDLNGLVGIEGTVEESRLDHITLTMELLETKLYKGRDISVSGTADYVNELLNIEEPLELSIGSSRVIVTGTSDFKNEVYNLDLDLDNADVFIINNFWSDSLENGKATGSLFVSGPFNNPSLSAELVLRNISYKNFDLESFEFFGSLNSSDQYTIGDCQLRIGSGTWNEQTFESGVVDLSYTQDGLEIQSAEFKNNNDFFQLSGFLKNDGNGVFDRLQIAANQQYLINTKPIEFTLGNGVDLLDMDWAENELTLKPFEFHVNDGILTGYLTLTDKVDGLLKISNIGTDIIDFLISDERIKIHGQVFGELSATTRENSLDYAVDLAIKNGEIASQAFDELIISTFYSDSILHIDEITLIQGDKTGIQIAGVVPQYYGESNPIEIDAMINMKKVDISIFTQFIPDWFTLDGLVSGDINFGGIPNKTKFNFDLSIDDGVFEGLDLGHVTGMGLFDSRRLYFNQFTAVRGKDHVIAGAAYLPMDLNFNSENLGEMFMTDSMWVDVSGDFNHLEFLSKYLIDVDSLPGKHNISMQITGPPDKILRNGKISIIDGSIYTVLLDEPIKGINGKGMLVNNLLSLKNLVGSANIKPENNKANIFIGGNINMTRFFEPYYDLSAKGSDVFFKTLLGDIEGMVNIDVGITGRDTIRIAGEIEAIDAVMYQEFEINTLPTAELDPSNTIINYKLNFPITGKFVLRNSQIDAQLGGELSISKFGEQSADYTGELFVREGKFYYYGDIFNITNGYLAFDAKGFNPYLDLSAFTTIKEENITITLVGPLDNPKLGLESSSGFSESDILELLTIRSRFEDQEISSSGLGSQAQSIFVAYLEKELERNFMQISGLRKLGIVEDVSISGASALIDPTGSDDLVIKAQVSRNLSLNYSYKRSFSFANPYLNQVGVELKLNPYFSLIGNVDELGNMHVKYRLRYSY